ncbi:recombination mediator RecR [Helicobacter sp. MIT 14-3879]|uniref:recombination mediator RecR n=1 Tax=Helicobacter sp. MIT 14-3879 TaxID=2040649 RepID=UPI000E1F6038|nr:recombination mediator RecR [Helicobacter sp. MIT 14-3879]RDU63531.1 recombination protein RecR [Helicobacter sp. MIT 14-3879]
MKNKFFNSLVEQLEQIPSIGKKSANKIAYTLALENKVLALNIAHCIENAVCNIQQCEICGGLAEDKTCYICDDFSRLYNSALCIVSSPKDIFTIEETNTFNGSYLVVNDVKKADFDMIIANIRLYNKKEIIFAFTPSLVSDTMILYIEDKLQNENLVFSKIAHGVPTGVGLDNIDKLSLQKAMESRIKI